MSHSRRERRKLQRMRAKQPAKQGGLDLENPKKRQTSLWEFTEHPLTLAALAIVAGVIGVVYFTPVLIVSGILLLVAVVRTKLVTVKGVKKLLAYAGITLAITVFIYGVDRLVKNKLTPSTPQLSVVIPPPLPVPIYMECQWDHIPIHVSGGSTVHVIRLHPDLLKGNPRFPSIGVLYDVSAPPGKDLDWPSKQEGKWMTRNEFQEFFATKKEMPTPFIFRCTARSSKPVDDVSLQMTVSTMDNKRHEFPVPLDPLNSERVFSFYVVNVCPIGVYVTWPDTATARPIDESADRQVPLKIIKRDWPGDLMIFGPSSFQWPWSSTCSWH